MPAAEFTAILQSQDLRASRELASRTDAHVRQRSSRRLELKSMITQLLTETIAHLNEPGLNIVATREPRVSLKNLIGCL